MISSFLDFWVDSECATTTVSVSMNFTCSRITLFSIFLSLLLSFNLSAQDSKPKETEAKMKKQAVVVLTDAKLEKLLNKRLEGGMSYSFKQFGNMFFVKSRIDLGTSIGLMSKSKEIPEKPLQSTFPTGYNPTLREFFDSIGRQTTSTWKYDPTNQFIGSQTKEKKKPAQIKDIAIFEFKETKERTKSFKFKLSEGWAAIDQGTWVMHRPPEYPVGMDIYELGEFSQKASEKADPDFSEKMRLRIAMHWAKRVNPKATEDLMKLAKVGKLDALFYDTMIPSNLEGEKVRWRQWIFMDGNRGYFIVITIFPDYEAKIFPKVEEMITSFELVKSESDGSGE